MTDKVKKMVAGAITFAGAILALTSVKDGKKSENSETAVDSESTTETVSTEAESKSEED